MLTPSHQRTRKRVRKPHQRRALTLLAGCGAAGCTEAVMVAHGFYIGQLDELVRLGLVAATTERTVGAGKTFEVRRLEITEEGQRALGG
jgi:hypothetical protein